MAQYGVATRGFFIVTASGVPVTGLTMTDVSTIKLSQDGSDTADKKADYTLKEEGGGLYSFGPVAAADMQFNTIVPVVAMTSGTNKASGVPIYTENDRLNSVKVSVGTGVGQINVSGGKAPATLAAADVSGNIAADVQTIKTQTVTAAAGVTFPASIANESTINTKIPTNLSFTGANVNAESKVTAAPSGMALESTAQAAAIGIDAVSGNVATLMDDTDELLRRTVLIKRVWVDNVNGNDSNSGLFKTAAKATLAAATALFDAYEGGQLFILGYYGNGYGENLTIPAGVHVIGVAVTDMPKINGTYVSASTPVITMGMSSKLERIYIKKWYAEQITALIRFGDGCEITKCQSYGTPFSGDLGATMMIDLYGATHGRIYDNELVGGSDKVTHAISDSTSNAIKIVIEKNVFDSYLEDIIHLNFGYGHIIRDNVFARLNPTYYAVKIKKDSIMSVYENKCVNCDMLVYEEGTGTIGSNLIQNNGSISNNIWTETITELSTLPGASPQAKQALALLYMALRNEETVTAISKAIKTDAGTTLASATLSDNGTTFTKGKLS